jgi:hypothetical protein
MSYVTKNIPNPELVEVFEKLPAVDLIKLVEQCKSGNYGVLASAIAAAAFSRVQPANQGVI